MKFLNFVVFFGLAACAGDESLRAYGGEGQLWTLTSIDGAQYPARATLELPEPGIASGEGPCNRWSASQTAPYPWFKLGPIAATRRACPDLDAEQEYFNALADMSISEILGNTLILSNDAGREMVFTSGSDGQADQ